MKPSPDARSRRRLRRDHGPDRTGPVASPPGVSEERQREEMAEIEADRRAERLLFTQALLALALVGTLVAAALAALP